MNTSNTSVQGPYHNPVQPLLVLPVALVIFVTMAGNLLVILAVKRTPQLQNTTSVFILSLACADLIVGCVVQPLSITMLLTGNWPLEKWACDLWTSVDVLCVTASTQTLCAIAVDRYVAVTRPLRYKALLDKRRARFIVCTVWTISALVSFVPIMGGLSHAYDGVSFEKCKEDRRCCDFILNKPYAIVSSIISFYIPLLVMLCLYGQVFVIATRQVKMIVRDKQRFRGSEDQQLGGEPPVGAAELPRTQARRSTGHIVHQHRALKTMGLIMGVFTLCWLPFFVANIVVAFMETHSKGKELTEKQSDPLRHVTMLLNWLGYINSGMNPIIYCHSSDYHAAIHSLLHLLKPKRPSLVGLNKQLRLHCPCLSRLSSVRVGYSDQKAFLPSDSTENSTQPPRDSAVI
ncbi:adrenoceptor beta 3b [Salminus brasiliensis]|uniref:adrenoceptor beta 3b n=1 Tax=Salminus brasiliensis TaxID=930266 RepID=UPI003B82D341